MSFKYRLSVKTVMLIDCSTGLLSISTELDREDTAEFRLNISAQDHGHPQRQSFSILTVTVFDVNDNPPSFEHSVYNATVEENLPVGSSVITIRATDNDTGEIHFGVVYVNLWQEDIRAVWFYARL